jgi:RHS repeat-associated protein
MKSIEPKIVNCELRGLNGEPGVSKVKTRIMCFKLWTVVYGLLALLLFSETSEAQLTISYSTNPVTVNQGTAITPLTLTVTGGTPAVNGQTLTIAGTGSAGFVNGTGTGASFSSPFGIVADGSGNMYISDAGNNVIRKMVVSSGIVTTFAGSGTAGSTNGTGTAASFNHPAGLSMDASGNVYVADEHNHLIRKISPAGVVTTLAGTAGTSGFTNGTGTAATFFDPYGVAADGSGNLYVADYGNNAIRKIVISTAVVTTFAGSGSVGSTNGTGTAATFNHPSGVATDASGNVYVADQTNNMIRKISTAAVVTTLAGSNTAGFGNGTGTAATFDAPSAVAVDPSGNVYVADRINNAIRAITPAGIVSTLSGGGTAGSTDGTGGVALFANPYALTADKSGNLDVCDYTYSLIRRVAYTPYSIFPYLTAGLSFSGTTGTISGTPTEAASANNFTVTAYSSTPATTVLTLTVNGTPATGPTLTNNYVITNAPRIAGLINDSLMMANANNKTNLQTSIQYVDGLGRPIQTVQEQASPKGYDMVAPQVYDQYGREVTKYLPYTPETGQYGNFRPNAVSTDQTSFYSSPPSGSNVSAITDPVAQTTFDNSPLNRPVEQGAPGAAWQITGTGDHTVKMIYTLNNATSFTTDSVNGRQASLYYTTINSDFSQTLHAVGYYPASTLTVTIMEDENWQSGRAGTVEEYKDIDGHVVLKRQYNYTSGAVQMLSTYYVYDDLGRLAFVLPPASGADGDGTISSTTLTNLCYQYQYDERGRPIQKKLPGKGWEYTVYNTMDQPVSTQDSLQRYNKQWIFAKYDGQQRVAITGIWNNNGAAISRASLKTTLDAITTNLYETATTTGNGYTNVAWPTTYVTAALSVNYYDSYSTMPGVPTAFTAPTGADLATRGELTGTLTNVLGSSNMLWTAHYYDYWGRSLESYAQHYLGGAISASNYDAVSSTYNFTNAPTTLTRKHWTSASTTYPLVTVYNKYIYDQVGRKLKTWEQLTNTNLAADTLRLISQTNYNEIGQIYNKQLASKDSVNFLQAIAYTYNERGWLLTSIAPLFQMQLQYNANPLGLSVSAAYNGNIASQSYGTSGSPNTANFVYHYDKINRLLTGTSSAGFTESGIAYDAEGNITALNRYTTGSTEIDQLGYTYTGNQLQTVADGTSNASGLAAGTTSYLWDGNGNMLSATNTVNTTGNKSFTYNLVNLPATSAFATGSATFAYDATGSKLRKASTVSGTTTYTDYIAGIQHSGTTSEPVEYIMTEEGQAAPNGTTSYDYQYFLGDNLGNTRESFGTKTGKAVQYQRDDYYPFGMEANSYVSSPKNYYLYNKKEQQPEFNENDYGARFYDPVIARWTSVDPLAEKARRWSPYNYVENNPIRMTDPDGMSEEDDILNTKDHEYEDNVAKHEEEENSNQNKEPDQTTTPATPDADSETPTSTVSTGDVATGELNSVDDKAKDNQNTDKPKSKGKGGKVPKDRIEKHHVKPKYLGGPKNGKTVPIPRGQHQGITNEFRKEWPYGTGTKPSEEELNDIMDRVYKKSPIPGFRTINPAPSINPAAPTFEEVFPEIFTSPVNINLEINFELEVF